MVVLELQPVQLPLQWPVPLPSWRGVPVHVGFDWAVAGRLPRRCTSQLKLPDLRPLFSSPDFSVLCPDV
jgi:hypothetical protein